MMMKLLYPLINAFAAKNAPQCRAIELSLDNRQEDAHEFLLRLLEHFDEELTKLSEVYKLLRVFDISIRSTTMCQRCFRTSELTDYLRVLSLQFSLGFAEAPPISRELDLCSVMNTYISLEKNLLTMSVRSVGLLEVLRRH